MWLEYAMVLASTKTKPLRATNLQMEGEGVERKRRLEEKIKRKEEQTAEEKEERKQEDDNKIELIIYYKNYNILK